MTTTTVQFPTNLPAPLIENYSMSPSQVFQRQQVSDGPPRYRLRSPQFTYLFDVEWHLSSFEFLEFRRWFQGFAELNFNRWFFINLAVGFAQSPDSPRNLEQMECHFFEDWQASIEPTSNDWRLRATLEARYKAATVATDNIISARSITELRPTDFLNARSITEERPTDIVSSASPSFWS